MVGTVHCVPVASRPIVISLGARIFFSLNLKLLEVLGFSQDQLRGTLRLKTSTKFLALGAASAACCALPFVVPLLAGSAVLAFFSPQACFVAPLAAAAVTAVA